MVRSIFIAVAVVVAYGAAWAQDHRNTNEDRACRGDAHRFCKDALPDEFRVASCLQEHRDRLSRACRAMLEGHGM